MIIMYTNHCPKCCILEQKLKEKNIKYEICDDLTEMIRVGLEELPVLKTDDSYKSFSDAVKWVNAQ